MGIGLNSVHLICSSLDKINNLDSRQDQNVLTLGVQDCYFDYATLMDFLRRHKFKHRDIPPDRIKLNTGFYYSDTLKKKYSNNVHQDTLFDVLGFSAENIESMDVMGEEQPTYVHDLNNPVPEETRSKYDIIIDGGTCEHIFSTKDVIVNLISMTKIGGLIIHHAPSDFINHGFINFNAEFFDCAYRVNGFDTLCMKYIFIPLYYRKAMDSYYIEYDCNTVSTVLQPYFVMNFFGVFKKTKEVAFRIPIQGELREKSTQVAFSSTGYPIGRWNRPGTLSGWLITQLDKSVLLSFIARGFYQLRKGRRVDL